MDTNTNTNAPAKTKKSANRKFNQETIDKRNASRNLKFDFKVDQDIAMPTPGHRSKYPFEKLNVPGVDSFFWPASASLMISIKNSARTKFNRVLVAFPRTEEHNGKEYAGYRFWLKNFVDPSLENHDETNESESESEAEAEAEAEPAQAAA